MSQERGNEGMCLESFGGCHQWVPDWGLHTKQSGILMGNLQKPKGAQFEIVFSHILQTGLDHVLGK